MSDAVDIKIYLQGLIRRDVSSVGAYDPKLAADFKADNRRLLTLTTPGSIRYIAATRAETRKLIDEGWRFDDETTAWAEAEDDAG